MTSAGADRSRWRQGPALGYPTSASPAICFISWQQRELVRMHRRHMRFSCQQYKETAEVSGRVTGGDRRRLHVRTLGGNTAAPLGSYHLTWTQCCLSIT